MEWRTCNSLGPKCKGPFFRSYSFITTACQKCRRWVICIVNHQKWYLTIGEVRVNFLVTWWLLHVRCQRGYLMTRGYVTTVKVDCIAWYQDGYLMTHRYVMTPWWHDESHALYFPYTQVWSGRHVVYLQDYVRGHPSTWAVKWLGGLSISHFIDLVGWVLAIERLDPVGWLTWVDFILALQIYPLSVALVIVVITQVNKSRNMKGYVIMLWPLVSPYFISIHCTFTGRPPLMCINNFLDWFFGSPW